MTASPSLASWHVGFFSSSRGFSQTEIAAFAIFGPFLATIQAADQVRHLSSRPGDRERSSRLARVRSGQRLA